MKFSPLVLFYEWKVTNTRFIFARLLVKRPCLHGHLTNAAEAYTGRYMAYAGNRRKSRLRPYFYGLFNGHEYSTFGKGMQGKLLLFCDFCFRRKSFALQELLVSRELALWNADSQFSVIIPSGFCESIPSCITGSKLLGGNSDRSQ